MHAKIKIDLHPAHQSSKTSSMLDYIKEVVAHKSSSVILPQYKALVWPNLQCCVHVQEHA